MFAITVGHTDALFSEALDYCNSSPVLLDHIVLMRMTQIRYGEHLKWRGHS